MGGCVLLDQTAAGQKYVRREVIILYVQVKISTTRICSPLIIIGVLANLLNIAMAFRDRAIQATTRILSAIISVINLTLLTLTPLYWHMYAGEVEEIYRPLVPSTNLLPSAIYIIRIFNLVRSWLFVLVSIERLLCFRRCHIQLLPWWTWRRLCMSIPLFFLLATAIHLPQIIYHHVTSEGSLRCPPKRINGVLNVIVELIFSCLGPILVHFWLLIQIEVNLRRQTEATLAKNLNRWRRAIKGLRLMTMIYVASIMPCITETVVFISLILDGWFGERALAVAAVFWGIAELAKIMIASENFVVYFLVSEAFRESLKKVLFLGNATNEIPT